MSTLQLPMLNEINKEGMNHLKEFIKKYFPGSLEIENNKLVSLDENVVTCTVMNSDWGGSIITAGNYYFYWIESKVEFDFKFNLNWLENPSLQNMLSFDKKLFNIIWEAYFNREDTKYCTQLYKKETEYGNRMEYDSGYEWYGYSQLYHLNIPEYGINKDVVITGAYRGSMELAPEVAKKVNANDYERIFLLQEV